MKSGWTIIEEQLSAIQKAVENYIQAEKEERSRKRERENIPINISGTVGLPEAIETKRNSDQDKYHTTQKAIAVAGWAAFVAALAYAVIGQLTFDQIKMQTAQIYSQSEIENATASRRTAKVFEQLNIAQKQAKAAEESVQAIKLQTRQDQRAWIQLKITFPKPQEFREGQTIDGLVHAIALGKTPSQRIDINARMQLIHNGQAIDIDYNFMHATDVRGFLFPQDTQDVPVSRYDTSTDVPLVKLPLTYDEAVSLNTGKAFLVIHVLVYYFDVFGTEHWIKSCAWQPYARVNARVNFSARRCATYNELDQKH